MWGDKRVTIADVAREAGVSIATVSKVVNRRHGIAASTQERVQNIIDQMGYVSNLGARSLRLQSTGMIGVLIPSFEPYSTEVLKGVSAGTVGTDYDVMAWSADRTASSGAMTWEHRLLARLAGTLIDGAIVVAPSSSTLTPGSFPVVAVDASTAAGSLPNVHAEDFGGARQAVQHLLDLGHRRIGYIGGRRELTSTDERERGFRTTLTEAGITPDPALMGHGKYTTIDTIEPARRILSAPERPTAIFAANDLSAIGVLEVARELGLRVPEDLSIVGFDNVPESFSCDPPLTTIDPNLKQLGTTALEMLLELISTGSTQERHRRLSTRLQVRGSTAAPLT